MRFDSKEFLMKHSAWAAINIGWAYMDYRGRIQSGQSPSQAAAGALIGAALFEMFPGPAMAWTIGNAFATLYPAYNAWQRMRDAQWKQLHRPNMGGYFRDNHQAMTMRQRAAQQIHEHHALARSVLGREARFFR